MSDIVERLRRLPEPQCSPCKAAADEIERLRAYRDEAKAETAVARLLVDRLRLTDADREAVEWYAAWVREVVPLYRSPTLTDEERRDIKIAADAYAYADHDPDCERIAATLRGLLERLK